MQTARAHRKVHIGIGRHRAKALIHAHHTQCPGLAGRLGEAVCRLPLYRRTCYNLQALSAM